MVQKSCYPVEVGSLSYYLHDFIHPNGGWEWDFWTINCISIGRDSEPRCTSFLRIDPLHGGPPRQPTHNLWAMKPKKFHVFVGQMLLTKSPNNLENPEISSTLFPIFILDFCRTRHPCHKKANCVSRATMHRKKTHCISPHHQSGFGMYETFSPPFGVSKGLQILMLF